MTNNMQMTSNSAIEKMKDELLVILAQRGLKITETIKEYTIKRANCDNRW